VRDEVKKRLRHEDKDELRNKWGKSLIRVQMFVHRGSPSWQEVVCFGRRGRAVAFMLPTIFAKREGECLF
jgi:hypothetical protein